MLCGTRCIVNVGGTQGLSHITTNVHSVGVGVVYSIRRSLLRNAYKKHKKIASSIKIRCCTCSSLVCVIVPYPLTLLVC